jgi:hypothetical protein
MYNDYCLIRRLAGAPLMYGGPSTRVGTNSSIGPNYLTDLLTRAPCIRAHGLELRDAMRLK